MNQLKSRKHKIMSTRANIIVKDNSTEVILYRHSDGYVEGLGEELNDFLKGFEDSVVWTSVYDIVGRLLTGAVEGIELTTEIHGDIEYKYVIDVTYGEPELLVFRRKSDWTIPTKDDSAWEFIGQEKYLRTDKLY